MVAAPALPAGRAHSHSIGHFRAWGQHSGKRRLLSICADGMDRKHAGLGGGVGWGRLLLQDRPLSTHTLLGARVYPLPGGT